MSRVSHKKFPTFAYLSKQKWKNFMGHIVVAPMNIESAPVHFCWYLAWWDRGLKGLELGLVNGVTDSRTDTALYN